MSRTHGEWYLCAERKSDLTASCRERKRIVGKHKVIPTLSDIPYDFVSAKVRKSLAAMVESSIARVKAIKHSMVTEIVRKILHARSASWRINEILAECSTREDSGT